MRGAHAVFTAEFRDEILSSGAAICLPDGDAVEAPRSSLRRVNMAEGGAERLRWLTALAADAVTRKLGRP